MTLASPSKSTPEPYTPTTQNVRDTYRFAAEMPLSNIMAAEQQFDRWLAAHDAEVAAKALRESALELRDELLNTRRGTYAEGQNVVVRSAYSILCAEADRIERAARLSSGSEG